MAGVANITGGNWLAAMTKADRDEKIKSGFTPYLSGAQVAGLTNVVMGDAYGLQVSGGANVNRGALIGFQMAGAANVVYKYSLGVQVAGLFNVAVESSSGMHVAGVSNYTQGQMAGIQFGALNQAGVIFGKQSQDNGQPTGWQVGLVNIAGKMNGFQFGLVNIADRSQGLQIGLVNIYKGGKEANTKDGTAIGLINIGDLVYASVYTNELFAFNYEVGTGNRKNGRIKSRGFNSYFVNALIFSHAAHNEQRWAMGYGFKHMFFNRSTTPGMAESKFWSYGLDVQHVNEEKGKLTQRLNLLSRANVMAGTRIFPKLPGINFFATLSFNAYLTDTKRTLAAGILEGSETVNDWKLEYWPGLAAGILLH